MAYHPFTPEYDYVPEEGLSDAQLGALIRRTLARSGVVRVVVFGRESKERVEAVRTERVYPQAA